MKSGLYVLPGASPTACAAAAASSFDFPITNVWNVYRSLSGVVGTPVLSTVAGSRGATKKSIGGTDDQTTIVQRDRHRGLEPRPHRSVGEFAPRLVEESLPSFFSRLLHP